MTAMGDFIVFIIKMALLALGLFLAYKVVNIIKDIFELVKKKNAADELRQKLDVFSVEAEVLNFTEKRVSRLDTQYDISVSYTVDDITYFTNVIIFNRGSLRVGQKIILLCDNDDFNNVVVQNGEEEDALKRLISRLIWFIIGLIVDFIGTCLDWRDILSEYNRAGLGAAVILILAMITANILTRLDLE